VVSRGQALTSTNFRSLPSTHPASSSFRFVDEAGTGCPRFNSRSPFMAIGTLPPGELIRTWEKLPVSILRSTKGHLGAQK